MMKDNGLCFACGRLNPKGLRLNVRKAREGVELDFTPPAHLQGWNGILHGGITSTILDELMAHACTEAGIQTVTAELLVRYRRPIPTGQSIHGTARVTGRRGPLVLTESRLLDRTGTVLAEATGKMMAVEKRTPGAVRRESLQDSEIRTGASEPPRNPGVGRPVSMTNTQPMAETG